MRASPYSRWRFALLCPRQRLAEQSAWASLQANLQIRFHLIITEAENPRLILLASVTLFKVALYASLPTAKARGAICVSVLASELSDTLSLDYQRSSHPTQYRGEIFRYCTRFSPRLATLDSHIPPFSTHLEHRKSAPSTPSRVCYCNIPLQFNQEIFSPFFSMKDHHALNKEEASPHGKNLYCLKQRKHALISFPEIDKIIAFILLIWYNGVETISNVKDWMFNTLW